MLVWLKGSEIIILKTLDCADLFPDYSISQQPLVSCELDHDYVKYLKL